LEGIFQKFGRTLNRRNSKIYKSAICNLDFRIRILGLRTGQPVTQLASNIFNPQSKFRNLKSGGYDVFRGGAA
jgi:hypothetical protein